MAEGFTELRDVARKLTAARRSASSLRVATMRLAKVVGVAVRATEAGGGGSPVAIRERERERRVILDVDCALEGFQTNVLHLKTYKQKLVVFPRRAGKFKAGDSATEELANATVNVVITEWVADHTLQGPLLAIQQEKPVTELVKVTADMKKINAYDKLRIERVNVRHVGARAKRAAEAEKEEKK
ncbi:60S ribosomal protein L13-1-like [Argentina anserina]|uniref:60S ribosomal protein L13-1-like n=1 Tax=Argentina anserina TaxID=57926 RepID=UPI00217621F5|nr:60S ribosomal protein L13-1-like [Potentilla anserina]